MWCGQHHCCVAMTHATRTEQTWPRRRGDSCNAHACDVVDVTMVLLPAVHVLLEREGVVARLGSLNLEIPTTLMRLVLMDIELDAHAKMPKVSCIQA